MLYEALLDNIKRRDAAYMLGMPMQVSITNKVPVCMK
jgi:hypothetical protein